MKRGATYSQLAFPRLPLWVRALNGGQWVPGVNSLIASRLTIPSITQSACSHVGAGWNEHDIPAAALQIILDETLQDDDLTLFGKLTVRRTLVKILVNRFRIDAELKHHPDTCQCPVERPLFIAGMPRTGTTLLQRLFAQDPQFRPILCWEAFSPGPVPTPTPVSTDPRIRATARELRLLHSLLPSLRTMHAMGPTEPEECEWLLQNSLTLPGFVFELPEFPRFNAWCRTQDPTAAYQYYRTQLQILQRDKPGQSWVLKGNEHLASLDALLRVFPDATVIQTHRDPVESLPSTLSLYLQLMGLKYNLSDTRLQLAIEILIDESVNILNRADIVRRSANPRQFLDVSYPELVSDPIAVMRRLYERTERKLTTFAERRMLQWLAAHPQGRHGRHRYSLEQFGLTKEEILTRFAAPISRFPDAMGAHQTSPATNIRYPEPEGTNASETAGLVTLEQAMSASDEQLFRWFSLHVNPREASLLRLGNLHRRYVRAAGLYLYDSAGREYLDMTSGCGSLPLGHNPPEVLEAVRAAQRLPAILLMGYQQLAGAVGKSLAALLPGDMSIIMPGSGGAEAVEIALITAVMATGRTEIIACDDCYHGHTLATLALSRQGRPEMIRCAQEWKLDSIPLGDLQALETRLSTRKVAAFLIEPILGEGGAILPPVGYLRAAAEVCQRSGTLLIIDEIQTGFGRTGQMFALSQEGVKPDIVAVGKAFGAGVVPISAAITSPALWKRAYGQGDHFQLAINTFGGNPAACAAALKTMEILVRDGYAERASALGDYARAKLETLLSRHEVIKAIRGRGLLLGIVIDPPQAPDQFSGLVISRLLERHGIIASYYERDRRILRFEPPLTITYDEIDRAVAAFDEVLGHRLTSLLLGHAAGIAQRSLLRPHNHEK